MVIAVNFTVLEGGKECVVKIENEKPNESEKPSTKKKVLFIFACFLLTVGVAAMSTAIVCFPLHPQVSLLSANTLFPGGLIAICLGCQILGSVKPSFSFNPIGSLRLSASKDES